jgi:hypothetical protein
MIEIIPPVVDSAFLYFHTRFSSGDEIAPFVDELCRNLPNTYVWAGDGCIEGNIDDPVMGKAVTYATGLHRYWFVFPMQSSTPQSFNAAREAMGAVLATTGGYVNAFVDQVVARYQVPVARVILCGHQHGACVALSTVMLRRNDPFRLSILFDPWPLEALYLQHEHALPQTKVICVDNLWIREREKQRGAEMELYKVFQGYGMNADGITLPVGEGKPDEFMFREAARLVRQAMDR